MKNDLDERKYENLLEKTGIGIIKENQDNLRIIISAKELLLRIYNSIAPVSHMFTTIDRLTYEQSNLIEDCIEDIWQFLKHEIGEDI